MTQAIAESASKGGNYVGALKVEVVTGTVDVAWNRAYCVEAVLCAERSREPDSCDLRYCVGLVGRLDRTRHEAVFVHRLGESLG